MTTRSNPLLQAGDRLTRDEFERRYAASPGIKKAELLEGVVYMPSPVRLTHHGFPHTSLAGWLSVYRSKTPGLSYGTDSTLRLDLDNEPQPDLLLRIDGPKGTSRIDADGYVTGAPELTVEVTASTVSYDLHQKLHVYRRSGVREYLVLRTEDREVDWFVLRAGEYERMPEPDDGILRSEAFPGLWLDVAALLRGDDLTLHEVVARGLATAEHERFVASLTAAF